MTTAINIENLSKKYVIGHQRQERYTALRDVMMHKLRGIGQRLRHPLSPNREEIEVEEFWALKDINLDIQQGDRVGIIGRNGAGKSTLLKILSRITEPTSGKVHINGRVASLLEVGTGFHPELSGRENIYLNGAILGMSRAEIKRKFDEIVDFAGVEKFLDTPVKRYSSGMYVRLAFAVAAHLDPEILIVDEVLAVGDAEFQKKCLGKMEEVGDEGRTVLFVSHNMGAIQHLCGSGILLNNGTVRDKGPINKVIETYLNDSTAIDKESIEDLPRASHNYGRIARFINAWPVNSKGERTAGLMSGDGIAFNLEIKAYERVDGLSIVAGVDTPLGYRVTTVLSEESGMLFSADKGVVLSINLRLPKLRLKPGRYSLTLAIRRNKVPLDHVVKALQFEVGQVAGNHQEPHIRGDILTESSWCCLNP